MLVRAIAGFPEWLGRRCARGSDIGLDGVQMRDEEQR